MCGVAADGNIDVSELATYVVRNSTAGSRLMISTGASIVSSKEIDLWIAGTSKENQVSVLSLDLSSNEGLTSLPDSMG